MECSPFVDFVRTGPLKVLAGRQIKMWKMEKKNMTIKWKKKGSNFIRSWTQTVLWVGKTNWSCIKVGIELGNFAQSHTRAVWLTSQTHGVQRNRFCIKCLCRVDMPLYDSCVGYTLTKPWQMLVSFPFKNVVIREQQVWWFFFFLRLCLFYSVLLQTKKNVCCAVKNPSATTTHATVVLFVQ